MGQRVNGQEGFGGSHGMVWACRAETVVSLEAIGVFLCEYNEAI